jgi:hypothetical protein
MQQIFEPQVRPPRPVSGNILIVPIASFLRTLKKGRHIVLTASAYDITNAIEKNDLKECLVLEVVPEQYYEFLPLFSKVLADRVLPHSPGIDHEVRLKDCETAM